MVDPSRRRHNVEEHGAAGDSFGAARPASLLGAGAFEEALRTLPVPGAPVALSADDAAVGLAFLDVALRQNHIRRLTERLSLIEHRVARRTTEVEISLGMLDHAQLDAFRLFQRMRSRTAIVAQTEESVLRRDDDLWVPLALISRRSVAPIDVQDAQGNQLPRLTQSETAKLVASGLYRLLRGLLSSHPLAREDSDIGRFLYRLDESRWLVQSALLSLLAERSTPMQQMTRSATEGTVGGHGQQYREAALSIIRTYGETLLKTYFDLIDVAINDYLLVIALRADTAEHFLRYDSPLHLRDEDHGRRLRDRVRTVDRSYRIDYKARIPSTLRSYHLLAETEPGVRIEQMCLVTDVDRAAVLELATDLRTVAHRLDAEERTPTGEKGRKLLELELQIALRRLSELLRRRRWDGEQAGMRFADSGLAVSSELAWAGVSGEATADPVSGNSNNSPLHHPLVTADALVQAADEIANQQLEQDIFHENDPASSRAHAYWRRPPHQSADGRPVRIRCALTLRDATGARPRAVLTYAASVSLIAYLIAAFLTESPFILNGEATATSNADAVIAVLLLVPGFLYTRLDLPMRQSIAGHLQVVPRFVAHVCIAAMVVMSAAIATGVEGERLLWTLLLCSVAPLVASVLLRDPGRGSREAELARLAPPRWLMAQPRGGATRADVVFHSSGSE